MSNYAVSTAATGIDRYKSDGNYGAGSIFRTKVPCAVVNSTLNADPSFNPGGTITFTRRRDTTKPRVATPKLLDPTIICTICINRVYLGVKEIDNDFVTDLSWGDLDDETHIGVTDWQNHVIYPLWAELYCDFSRRNYYNECSVSNARITEIMNARKDDILRVYIDHNHPCSNEGVRDDGAVFTSQDAAHANDFRIPNLYSPDKWTWALSDSDVDIVITVSGCGYLEEDSPTLASEYTCHDCDCERSELRWRGRVDFQSTNEIPISRIRGVSNNSILDGMVHNDGKAVSLNTNNVSTAIRRGEYNIYTDTFVSGITYSDDSALISGGVSSRDTRSYLWIGVTGIKS